MKGGDRREKEEREENTCWAAARRCVRALGGRAPGAGAANSTVHACGCGRRTLGADDGRATWNWLVRDNVNALGGGGGGMTAT